ncbi:hypothetical protein SAMN03159511_2245 [Pseudomonas sp. NFACC19-2]|nr:hypothetical protein [Pseudomonas sp. NFACC19-2]SFW31827.1 hypothetical protein SAMN03159511_2245 [Pseudomonas sp. NFACC19-2]
MQEMFTPNQLAEMSERIGANADRLITKRTQKKRGTATLANKAPGENRGRPARRIPNPFAFQIGPTTEYDRYPAFAMDIIEGIARLDWHDRKEGGTDASKPLSVKLLMTLLASLEEITTTAVMSLTELSQRHALRYAKALELAMPRLMASRPQHLIEAMGDRNAVERCPIYLRRIHTEKTYRVLGGSHRAP